MVQQDNPWANDIAREASSLQQVVRFPESMKALLNKIGRKSGNEGSQETPRIEVGTFEAGKLAPNSNAVKPKGKVDKAKRKEVRVFDRRLKELRHENIKLDIMKESELYYQRNFNQFNNNMSLLALNTFEIEQSLDGLKQSHDKMNSISANIAAHTTYIKTKSKDIEDKLMILRSKMQAMKQKE